MEKVFKKFIKQKKKKSKTRTINKNKTKIIIYDSFFCY